MKHITSRASQIVFLIFTWCFSATVFASTSAPDSSATDLSIHYLHKLFGYVPGVLSGDSTNILGKLFYVYNQGIMVIVAAWLIYTIFNITVTATLSGFNQSKHNVTMVLLRTVVALALLVPSTSGYCVFQEVLMKATLEGVHLADKTWQYALKYLDEGGKIYVPEGGVAGNTLSWDDLIPAYMTQVNLTGGKPSGIVREVVQNETCMLESNNVIQGTKQTLQAGYQHPYKIIFVPPKVDINTGGLQTGTGTIYFPGYDDSYPYNSADLDGDGRPSQLYAQNCGSIAMHPNLFDGATLQQYQETFLALKQMVIDLEPLSAKLITTNPVGQVQGGKALSDSILTYFKRLKPVIDYQVKQQKKQSLTFIKQAKKEGWLNAGSYYWDISRLNDDTSNRFDYAQVIPTTQYNFDKVVADNHDHGWPEIINRGIGVALGKLGIGIEPGVSLPLKQPTGMWQHALNNLYKTTVVPNKNTGGAVGLNDDEKDANYQETEAQRRAQIESDAAQHPDRFIQRSDFSDSTMGGVVTWNSMTDAEKKEYLDRKVAASEKSTPLRHAQFTFDVGEADPAGILLDAAGHVMYYIMHNEQDTNNPAYYDPILFAEGLGKYSLASAGRIWTKAAHYVNKHETKGAWYSMIPIIGKALSHSETAQINFAIPLWTGVSSALFYAGFMLGFYAPLYPYLLFLFGGISWMMCVLEGMVAIPLVCIGLTHPDGQDFTGRAEQALMLSLSIVLRPVLMVIGFIAGVLLSYVSFSIVNHMFGRVVVGMFAGNARPEAPIMGITALINGKSTNFVNFGQFTGNSFADLIVFCLLIVAYGLISVEIVTQSFGAIHLIPDMVLRWIGGPVQQDQSENFAGKVKAGLSTGAQQGGKMGGDAVIGAGKAQGSVNASWIQAGGSGLSTAADIAMQAE
ncbi:MAG: DotA/TraY family protein [Coxiellaceae bacterium]|nr:DotA/TraY family protein [Coxiellaceae bacterium]